MICSPPGTLLTLKGGSFNNYTRTRSVNSGQPLELPWAQTKNGKDLFRPAPASRPLSQHREVPRRTGSSARGVPGLVSLGRTGFRHG